MNQKSPFQYSKVGRIIKKLLHIRLGAWIGYKIGLSGFNKIEAKIIRANGKVEYIRSYNSRVNKGADLVTSLLVGTAQNSIASPLPPKYIALSTSVLTPAYGDTTLTGETSASGLARALATISTYTTPGITLDGSASIILTKTFTNTSAGTVTINSAALFDAVSTGNMFVEGNLSSTAVLAIGDSIIINWTVAL